MNSYICLSSDLINRVVTWGLLLHTIYVKLRNKASEHHCPPLDNTVTAGAGKQTFRSSLKEGNSGTRNGHDRSNFTSDRTCLFWAYFQGELCMAFTSKEIFSQDSECTSLNCPSQPCLGLPPMHPLFLELHFSAGLSTQTLPELAVPVPSPGP